MPQTLAQDLDIRLKHVVRLVKYNATGAIGVSCHPPTTTTIAPFFSGVEITCSKLTDDNEVDDADVSTIKADVCLCTLPLGVLKHALAGDKPKFEPALPDWKAQAIRRLGFGNLNKVRITETICLFFVKRSSCRSFFALTASFGTRRAIYSAIRMSRVRVGEKCFSFGASTMRPC